MPTKIGLAAKIYEWTKDYFDFKEDIPPKAPLQLNETILFTKDIDDLLSHYEAYQVTTSITGTGYINVFNAGKNKVRIDYLYINRAGGTWTFTSTGIWDESKNQAVIVETFGSSNLRRYPQNLAGYVPIWLEPYDAIRIYVDAHTVTGNCTVDAWCRSTRTNKLHHPQDDD